MAGVPRYRHLEHAATSTVRKYNSAGLQLIPPLPEGLLPTGHWLSESEKNPLFCPTAPNSETGVFYLNVAYVSYTLTPFVHLELSFDGDHHSYLGFKNKLLAWFEEKWHYI